MYRLGRRRDQRSGAAPQPEAASSPASVAASVDGEALDIIRTVRPETMVSDERLIAVVDAVRYVHARQIPGSFVECGVWRGGVVLAMALTLCSLEVDDRDIYLFDTFAGMTEPGPDDTSDYSASALEDWNSTPSGERPWAEAFGADVYNVEYVREVVLRSGYPAERFHLVEGPVEQTVPAAAPEQIALLRLDTDWYESTHHELVHLYPRLSSGGVLVIDDYGHWHGARRAVDEYFEEHEPLLLARTDYTGRMAVKH